MNVFNAYNIKRLDKEIEVQIHDFVRKHAKRIVEYASYNFKISYLNIQFSYHFIVLKLDLIALTEKIMKSYSTKFNQSKLLP